VALTQIKAGSKPMGNGGRFFASFATTRGTMHHDMTGLLLDSLTAWCGTPGSLTHGGMLAGMFLVGAAGSTMHCVPMCGGFVLGQVADRMAAMPVARLCEWRRVSAGALLPYHLGRLTTYGGLGAVAGLGGGAFARLPWFSVLSGLLLLVAAVLFLLQAVRRLQGVRRALPGLGRRLPWLDAAPLGWNRVVARLSRGLPRGRPSHGYLLGVTLGFLPCGLLYAALAVAAASLSPLLGGLQMVAFGAGTALALIATGIAGQAAGRRWHRGIAVAAPVVMLLNAVLLSALALQRLAVGV
jgi:sulfite exporter TauE/SafE